ncbi:hypothetical protein CJ030_MR1G022065 [Morella rubra]|uniref:RNase H type-1 domain-containing protein n=1 Tax=Morella rubra TaxID=262757 RepID=A0A6A1WRE9_9ROSI|nr:hypothetical protein CJ030_MR1G022065 [Morella rubra]
MFTCKSHLASAVLFDSSDNILQAWSGWTLAIDLLLGESEAALLALAKASEANISSLLLTGDSAVVIACLNSGTSGVSPVPWRIASLISDAMNFIQGLSWFSACKISRDDNYVAHSVAAWAAALSHVGEVPASFLLNRGFWKYNGAKPP